MRPLSAMSLSLTLASALAPAGQADEIELNRDDAEHVLTVSIDGKMALAYHYDPDHFLPYFHPVLSPSGKKLTVRLTKPYPHHRSFWVADRVQLDGHPAVNFYAAYYKNKHRIRHDDFTTCKVEDGVAVLGMKLLWELNRQTPVLAETRDLRIKPLGDGEWFMDLRFTVAADYGDVHFVSDAVHYAWPYIRMHPQFSVKEGGRLVNSEGGVNQKGTHNKVARWCDYSNTIDGVTEGLAFFSHSENAHPHRWLTRDYGCFGPRRPDIRSGKRFTLKKGDALTMRVGILVHKGDAKVAQIPEQYQAYLDGPLSLLPVAK
ncbi:MAG: DUF6807 family protein [Planctomycetota bacterium]